MFKCHQQSEPRTHMAARLFIALLGTAELIPAQPMQLDDQKVEERRYIGTLRHDNLVTVHLSTTLTFAALGSASWSRQDGNSEMEPEVVASVPEVGTDLRADLESKLADSLLESLQDATLLGGGAARAQGVAVTSITEGQMDGHWPPVHYAFVDVSAEIGVYVEGACLLKVEQLNQTDSCWASVYAVADAASAASASLAAALSDLDICFTEECEDEYSNAEPRAGDFEVTVEGQTLPTQVLRAAAGKKQLNAFWFNQL